MQTPIKLPTLPTVARPKPHVRDHPSGSGQHVGGIEIISITLILAANGELAAISEVLPPGASLHTIWCTLHGSEGKLATILVLITAFGSTCLTLIKIWWGWIISKLSRPGL